MKTRLMNPEGCALCAIAERSVGSEPAAVVVAAFVAGNAMSDPSAVVDVCTDCDDRLREAIDSWNAVQKAGRS